ncbi:MAG: YkgJ family cysteine cluster protein [Candidatus Omnitrophica bacterium]|nr:YkgJ family cysteine cluster protein [Candidatus Omnitrophota bacterium]
MRPEVSLKQFVPSLVCLKCDGCCRYKQADSIWRPKLGQNDQKNLGTFEDYVQSVQVCGQHFCRFLNTTDNTCGVYNKRPFECLLYPFILSQRTDTIQVYVHLSCPFVQDHQPKEEFKAYVEYLKDFFSRQDIREFLIKNKAMFHDYTPFAPELLHLFDFSYE